MVEIVEIGKIRNKKIRKANDLIQKSRFSLSLQQQKIILYLIAQISPYDKKFKIYEFSIKEFCHVCDIQLENGKNYINLKSAIKALADKSLWIMLENGDETLLRWIQKATIIHGEGTIQIRLDDDMIPFLLQLKQNYTQYALSAILHFRCKYSIRLYELIQSIHYHPETEYRRQYFISELQKLLGAENYAQYRDFKRRALMPAVEEINSYSDKSILLEEIRKGRKVVAINLIISSKNA